MKKVIFFFSMMVAIVSSTIVYSQQFQYGFSEAIVTSTGRGTNVTFTDPYTGNSRNVFAGLINGTVDGHSTKFYCIDIKRTISFPDSCHRDSAIANSKIVYILNNYYPYVSNPPGKLSDNDDEAAATQLAIWHFSDGVNLNTISGSTIRNRAKAIANDADANGGNTNVLTTLSIQPSIDPDAFYIETKDQDGNPVAISNIQLSIDQGSLSSNTVSTNASGISPDVYVIGTGSGVITATAGVTIPQGISFACPPGKQRLVIAMPTIGERRAIADWGALPVELASFVSNVSSNNVTLSWTTVSELNNSSFSIERKSSVSADWNTIGSVGGNGTSNVQHSYSYTDRNLNTGTYNYRLKQIDYNGNFEYFELSSEVSVGMPGDLTLNQNYPNPFNPATKISFDIPKDGMVTLKVYDYIGREVATLVNEHRSAGYYSIEFNGSNLTSGIYFYKLVSNGKTKVMKMSLIK